MNNSALDALTLDQLRLFVTVIEEGSFSAAARKLGRAQSAVSYGLANLEQLLDVQLFDRRGRAPVLTSAGEALLPYARGTLEHAGKLAARASALSGGVEPNVRIAVDALCPAELLVEIGRGFHAQFPAVSLQVDTDVLEAVPALVLDGTCDIGIAGPAGSDNPALERRLLSHVDLVTVAAPDHPLARAGTTISHSVTADHVQVAITRNTPTTADGGVRARTVWRVADMATKLALLRAGLGWGNVPLSIVEPDLASGTLVRLELEEWGQDVWRVPLWSVVAVGASLGPAAQWLLAELAAMRARCGQAHGDRTGAKRPEDFELSRYPKKAK